MKHFLAFLRKEAIEHKRTGKCTILGILFVLFGIMNPAIAKMTPWLLQARLRRLGFDVVAFFDRLTDLKTEKLIPVFLFYLSKVPRKKIELKTPFT